MFLWAWLTHRNGHCYQSQQENVILCCLPPHTTHILQSVDVSVFAAVKRAWGKILKDYKSSVCDATVTKQVFPSLLARLWDESMHPEHLVSGFRATGLHPLNRNAIKIKRFKPKFHSTQSNHHNRIQSLFSNINYNKNNKILTDHFQVKLQLKKPQKERIKPNYYGQPLTSNDAIEIIQKREERKKKRAQEQAKSTKSKSNDKKEDQQNWIGCDNHGCWCWYNF